jgi:uncharacterized repeat protein (TIGR01451 family)
MVKSVDSSSALPARLMAPRSVPARHANRGLLRWWLCGLVGMSGPALADGIYMTNMKTALTPASISMLSNPARAPGAQVGDIVEFVLSATVANAPGGPGVYFTAYPAPGLTVLGASFVTDATGSTVRAPGAAGRAHDGWGPRGSKTPFGAPFVGVLNGRQNDVYGDTGVFYSTDTRTRLFTSDASNIARGPIGNPTSSSAVSNGYNVTDTFYKDVGAFNLWDANQVNAFGSGGALGSVPVNAAPTSSAVVINSIGQGVPPFGAGSSVAGPQTGYMLDNSGNVGPWQRVRAPGSLIADVSDGPALAVGTADTPTVLDASGLGLGLSDSNPLSAATNAVRWADGFHALAETVFVKIRVRIDAPVLLASDGVMVNFESTGSDNWATGSKDNPWRYFGPTVAQSGAFSLSKDIVSVNGVAYGGGAVPAGATLVYRIRYLNLGNLPVNVGALIDKLPAGVATLACSIAAPTLSNATAGVSFASVSAGSASCPAASSTLTFGNLPNIVGGRLGALRGGEFSYQVKLSSALTNGTAVSNQATLSGTDVVSGALISQTSTVSATIGVVVAAAPSIDVVMALNGAATQVNATSFDVPYSVVVSNSGTVSAANVQVNAFLPTAFADGNPTVSVSGAPSLLSGACVLNAAFDGNSDTALLAGSDTLAAGQSCTLQFSAHVVYPSAAAVPAAAQNNSAFASSAAAVNGGYSFPAGVATAPAAALATDVSTHSSTPPATPHADTPSPTPVFLPKLVGFESVKLSADVNASGTPTAGDTLTWTIVYANTGGVAVGSFQINQLLPTGVSLAGAPSVLATGVGTAASANLSYSGAAVGVASNLLAAGAACAPGCVITVTVPVTINPAFAGTLSSQAIAMGTGLATLGISSDNVDSNSSGLPNGISVPSASITQVQTAAIDATTVNVVAAPVGLLISGTVFNDSNGLSDGLVNGVGSQAGSSTLTAYLVGGGSVVAVSAVAANGSYSFANVAIGNYSVVLSNSAVVTVGAAAPVASLPAGWVNTGEGTVAAGDGQVDGIAAVTVAGASVSGVNFGIEQAPVAGNLSLAAQANTGSASLLPVPAAAFTGALPTGASGSNASDATGVTDIRLSAFPSNVSSINLNGTNYTSFPAGGVSVSVAQLANLSIVPLDGNVTVVIAYVALDAAGQSSGAGSVSVPLNVASYVVSGTVLNDSNGLSDGIVNGTGTQAGSSTLTAYLVAAGKVVAANTVAANGGYSFASVPNGSYNVVLSNSAGVAVGAAAPVASLPTGWVNTGEGTAAAGDGQADGSTAISVAGANVSGANFGIEQPPVTGQLTLATQANPGGVNTVMLPAGAFTGTLPAGSSGTNASDATAVTDIRLTSFPSNVTSINVGGTNYTSFAATGLTVSVAQLAGMSVDPVDGNVNVVINFVALDAAAQTSGPGSITLPFSDISFSVTGSVLNDSNGLSDGLINGPGTQAASSTLTAYLVSGGKVVASSGVAGNGSYGFVQVANGDYSVVLSNTATLAVGAAAPATTLPAGWVNTGEGTAAAGDGLVDGSTTITVAGANLSNVNFGIEQPPFAVGGTLAAQVNPGNQDVVAVPVNLFTASTDAVPGTVTAYRLTSFPANANSLVVNGNSYSAASFPAQGLRLTLAQLSTLAVDPIDGGLTVSIPFRAIDDAGIESINLALAQLPLQQPIVGVAMAVMAAPEQMGAAAFAVPYRVVVANPANAPLASNVQVLDNLNRAFRVGGANPSWRIKNFLVTGLAGALCTAPTTAFDGDASQALLAGNNNLAAGQACQIDFTVQLDYGSNVVPGAALLNQALASIATTPNSGGSLPNNPTAAPSVMAHALASDLSDAATVQQLSALASALLAANPSAVNDGVPGVPTGGKDDPTPVLLPRLAAIQGSVFVDRNGNHQADPGEQVQGRYLVQVVAPINPADPAAASSVIAYLQAVTDAAGNYTIAGVPTGTHLAVRMVALAANTGTTPQTAVLATAPGSSGLPIVADQPVNGSPALNATKTAPVRGYLPLFVDASQLPANGVVMAQDMPIDPSGVVYDSTTRQPVVGATVQLQTSSGTSLPAGVLFSGSADTVLTNADGVYSFLFASAAFPGRYLLRVTPPADHVLSQLIPPAPELLLTAGPGAHQVQAQDRAPAVGQPTKYHLAFNMTVARDVIHNHIPLDPITAPRLALSKTGDRAVVELLDSMKYTLQVRRSDSGAQMLAGVTLTDRLPAGFKYLPGTLTVNGVKLSDAAAGIVGTGPLLNFNAGPLVAGGTLSVSYRVRVGVGAQEGDGINRAWAGPAGVNCAAQSSQCSNEARFQVQVSGGVFSRQACVVGKVFVDCNHNQMQGADEPGIPGVRLLLQDGSVVVTDVDGKYSFCGIAPRTHVLKVDGLSLPKGSQLVVSSSRNVGDAQSIFINPIAGELHRADFIEGSCSSPVLEQVKARRSSVEKPSPSGRQFDAPALKFNGKVPGHSAAAPAPDSPAPPPPASSGLTQNLSTGQ